MDDNNIRRFNRVTRVKTFGEIYAADFAPGSKATSLFLELHPIVTRLNEATVGQLRTPVGKSELIAALSLDFKDIARTARAIKIDQPGFDDSAYRHPATSVEKPVTTHADSLLKRLKDNTAPVADGGDTPAQLAEKAALRANFIAYELPADFVEDLRADRDAIDGKNLATTADNLEGLESTESISVLLIEGGKEVTRLDAMMQNLYRRNPAKLHAWLAASRVERAAKKAAPVTPPSL